MLSSLWITGLKWQGEKTKDRSVLHKMPLQEILETSAKRDSLTQKKLGFSRERVMAQMPIIR